MIIFLLFAALLVWFSLKSFLGGLRYLAFFRAELAKPLPKWTPFATVICPCRGVDDGMTDNLRTLVMQDYPEYEIIFVVDDPRDPAAGLIDQALIAKSDNVRSSLVVAQPATDSAQKVENLREAVLHGADRSEVFVFVDSDTRVSPQWLRYLVGAVEPENVGAATGYRWFISGRPSFASEMCSVWNASIASALGPNRPSNFCWGGSTAMRRDVFERVGIREKWRGTLSDDFTVTRVIRNAGLDIVHVPKAVTATVERCTLGELLEFTTRQMKITRVYMRELWLMSFFGSALFFGVMLAAFLIVVIGRENTFSVWAAAVVLVIVSSLSTIKSWIRLGAIRLALPQFERELRRQLFTQSTLWVLSPPLFLYNSIAALVSRRMTWRGIRYELKSPTETVIIRSE